MWYSRFDSRGITRLHPNMLARHLLFIATRRHHNTLLAIDSSVPPHGLVQPPPYISPPNSEQCRKKDRIQEISTNRPAPHKIQNEKQQTCGRQSSAAKIHSDPRRNLYEANNKLTFDQTGNPLDRNDSQRVRDPRRIVDMRNARNQQYYAPPKDSSQQFYTLPSRRPQRDVEPPRSVTPDITRGLGRGGTMHVLARHGHRAMMEQDCNRYGSQAELNKRNSEAENRLMQNHEHSSIVDIRNRFATPLGLTALGYRFFASSPVRDPVTKSPSADALKYNPISPIGHGYGNSFKSSTPTGRSVPTVAERLALTANNNSSSSMPNSGRSTPVQTSSGRSTPTNLLSPTKSTMSNEELFAAIHKSKKRLNIRDESENLSPYGSTSSLVKMTIGNKNDWNCAELQKSSTVTQTSNQPPSPATSRLDFKRLLLQQSVKTGPARLSAAEQLKLSRQQCQQQQHQHQQQQQQSSPGVQQTASLAKVLSPRSIWRFQTPRTDVLSSTIIEDTAAEEKAMKPSPENASPVSRVNARRQLDLCNDLPDEDSRDLERTIDERTLNDADRSKSEAANGQREAADNCTDNSSTTTIPYPVNCAQLTPSCQQAISAFESRRISNQLARAQFLAGTPTTAPAQGATKTIFRARSESPQNNSMQSVARSPSVPTLETAL